MALVLSEPSLTQQDIAICQRIYTDADLYDPGQFTIITESSDQILGELENMARDKNVTLPPGVELVLEIIPLKDDFICGYYFVNHNSRCLFWLQEFDAEEICDDIRVVVSLSHLRELDLHTRVVTCNVRSADYIFNRIRDRVPVLVSIDVEKAYQKLQGGSSGRIGNYSRILAT